MSGKTGERIWIEYNKLVLNIFKTNFIVFGHLPSNKIENKIVNTTQQANTVKPLGFIVFYNLFLMVQYDKCVFGFYYFCYNESSLVLINTDSH